jgi:hypothetical protein
VLLLNLLQVVHLHRNHPAVLLRYLPVLLVNQVQVHQATQRVLVPLILMFHKEVLVTKHHHLINSQVHLAVITIKVVLVVVHQVMEQLVFYMRVVI